jgi:hypothetical protein
MSSESYKDRDGPEFIDAHGDNLEIYPTVGGKVCIRQTKAGTSGEFPSIYIHPENIGTFVELLQLVRIEAIAWGAGYVAKSE